MRNFLIAPVLAGFCLATVSPAGQTKSNTWSDRSFKTSIPELKKIREGYAQRKDIKASLIDRLARLDSSSDKRSSRVKVFERACILIELADRFEIRPAALEKARNAIVAPEGDLDTEEYRAAFIISAAWLRSPGLEKAGEALYKANVRDARTRYWYATLLMNSGDVKKIETAIWLLKKLREEGPHLSTYLYTLAGAYWMHFEHSDSRPSADRAVQLYDDYLEFTKKMLGLEAERRVATITTRMLKQYKHILPQKAD